MKKTFEIIENILKPTFEKNGFIAIEDAKNGDDDMLLYKNDSTAYSVIYDKEKGTVVLRSAKIEQDEDDEENELEWKNISQWLYDQETCVNSDVESIARDFSDIIGGPEVLKTIKEATQKKKKNKNDERNVDDIFFFNRLVGFFPELKEEMNKDRVKYGKIRFATLTKSCVAPAVEKLASYKSQELTKLTELFNDMYKDGDIEVRGMVIHGIFNNLSDRAMENIQENFSEELEKTYKCSRKLKDKKIKPEKENKSSAMKRAIDNAQQKQLEKNRELTSGR